jgi:hypothetical protein
MKSANLFIKLFILTSVVFCLVQMLICWPLWTYSTDRLLPPIPLGFDLEAGRFLNGLNVLLVAASFLGLIGGLVTEKPLWFWAGLLGFGVLIILDINRFQSWLHFYLIIWLFYALSFKDVDFSNRLSILQFGFIAVYFWSGVHKLHPHFYTNTYQWMMSILAVTKPISQNQVLSVFPGLVEAMLGLLLWPLKTRKYATLGLIVMHLFILSALVADGWNVVVWPWNVFMIVSLFLLFIKTPNQQSLNFNTLNKKLKSIYLITCVILPFLFLFNTDLANMAFSMYCGRTVDGKLIVPSQSLHCFDGSLKEEFETFKDIDNLQSLDLDTWAGKAFNTPIVSSQYLYKRLAKHYAHCAPDSIGLIIKKYNFFEKKPITEVYLAKDLE